MRHQLAECRADLSGWGVRWSGIRFCRVLPTNLILVVARP
jgi:hypothetical protein